MIVNDNVVIWSCCTADHTASIMFRRQTCCYSLSIRCVSVIVAQGSILNLLKFNISFAVYWLMSYR